MFQDGDFKEGKVVVLEIGRFLKKDIVFMTVRPLRYSLVLDSHPDNLHTRTMASEFSLL